MNIQINMNLTFILSYRIPFSFINLVDRLFEAIQAAAVFLQL